MNKYFFYVLFLIVFSTFSHSLFAQQQNFDDQAKPVVLFVEFQFDVKDMDLAVELLTEVQNQTYENEEGCITYDLHLSEENPTTIYIYECYENSAALKLHNSASYFKSIVEMKLVPIIKTEKILTLHPINDIGIEME